MQAGLKKAQDELAQKTYIGSAGGGVVTPQLTGSGALVAVESEPEILDPDDSEVLGDLVVAAVNQARGAAEAEMSAAPGGLTAGMDVAGLLG